MRRLKSIETFMRWKWYPDILRIPVFIGTTYLMYLLLFGEQNGERNAGLSIMWVLWWSMQPVFFILLGRFWCGICPFSTAGEWIKKIVGNGIHPPLFLKKNGTWFAFALFLLILVLELLVKMPSSTSATSILLFTIFTMAMISGAFFARRTWCRYLCPLGVTGGVFSRLRIMGLRSDSSICGDCKDYVCFKGTEKAKGCPMGLCAQKHDLDADCISCGNCLKTCPNDSPRVTFRAPVKGFETNVKMNPAESVFASCFIGLTIALILLNDYENKFSQFFGMQHPVRIQVLVMMLLTGLSFSLFYMFSYLIRPIRQRSRKYNFMFFGFFLIPYIFFALLSLTTIREVLVNGTTLVHNFQLLLGRALPAKILQPLVSMTATHFIQGFFIITGSIISIAFCFQELQKFFNKKERNKNILVFTLFITLISTISLYLLYYFN